MAMIDGMLQELDMEAQTTRRLLERVPDHKLEWRPHAKARTLGQLAMHVATVPGSVAELAATPSPAQVPQFSDPPLKSAAELLAQLIRELQRGAEEHAPLMANEVALDDGLPAARVRVLSTTGAS